MKTLSETSMKSVKGVGPAKLELFERLGVRTVEDLLYFFPKKYQDRRSLVPIAQVEVGEFQAIVGQIQNKNARKSWHTKKHLTEVVVDDGGGKITCVWFNQPYLEKTLRDGARIVCFGKIDMYKNRLQMVSPEYELISEDIDLDSLKRIVPMYPLTKGITQRFLRKMIDHCIETYNTQMVDHLSVSMRNAHRLANIKRSIRNIHFPQNFEDQEEAITRISFEEFYFFQISILLRRMSITKKPGVSHQISGGFIADFMTRLPFDLTGAQERVIDEIRRDMKNDAPMLRLLQGDVGSGKTLVAFFGCLAAVENGNQAAMMAPTEILACQHYLNIKNMMEAGTIKKMKVALLVNALTGVEKESVYERLASGAIDCVIGTHSLLGEELKFKQLSFVVIDEQHKFGVRQRALLARKGANPDVLIMTATPIPRTLCITLYGDLDVSIIDQLPKGRGEIKTSLHAHENANEVYAEVANQVKQGRQAYIVYPIIEESEKIDLKAAQDMYREFMANQFKHLRVGLVHGRLKPAVAQKMMTQFKGGEIDVLVATTVLEVGVDVPNASIMVIEHAERFGLAQLHQLRGRIGRGTHNSKCMLISNPTTDDGQKRLKALVSTTDGFKIANIDLEIRGPGRFFGRHQHGLNELKVANPLTQIKILELARKEAISLLKDDPELNQDNHYKIKFLITQRYPTYLKDVGAD